MLARVYELLITQLHIFSINFINILSYYRGICYLVFPALFPSTTSMVFNDYTLLHMSQNIVNLSGCYLNDLKFLHYFSGQCYICYPQNSIKQSS